ncbi:hypothetical protein OGAPHI_004711 [Ogataea philodendri]|uniref:Uncharacterized protein n=1 Tax=Ogataea philodendri TaxID=1378263 RepID=A0A9P8P2I7_9ASCO|nr:uncharacterized protein OGAPHI_004711 [Ogataea philodendri]KAH3663997.1 hypothetical protein OGAPHI_004711 [Ogataea philodendri]
MGSGASSRRPTTLRASITLVLHGLGNLDETGNVGAHDKRWERALVGLGSVSGGSLVTGVEAVDHDVLELLVDLLGGPLDSLGVLGHLQARNGNTTTVGSLTWSVPDSVTNRGSALSLGLEHVDGVLGGSHVGSLGNVLAAGSNKSLGLLARNLVLGGRRKSNVDLSDMDPRSSTLDVLDLVGGESRVLANNLLQGLELDLGVGNGLDVLLGDSGLGNNSTLGVGQRNNSSAKLDNLQSSVLGNVTGTRHGNSFASKRLLTVGGLLDHLLDVVHQTVTGGLWSDQRSTPGKTLTGENSLPLVLHLLVGTEHEADLTASGTNVTGRNVGELANVSGQLSDESGTESSDLVVALTLRVEVGTTLTTSHGETSESVLEDLFVTKELQDGKVDTWVQSQTSLVWAESRVELHSVTSVNVHHSLVILPGDSELDDSLWNRNNRNDSLACSNSGSCGWTMLLNMKTCNGGRRRIYVLEAAHH